MAEEPRRGGEGGYRGRVFEEDEEELAEVPSHSGKEVRLRRSGADRLLPERGEGS